MVIGDCGKVPRNFGIDPDAIALSWRPASARFGRSRSSAPGCPMPTEVLVMSASLMMTTRPRQGVPFDIERPLLAQAV